MAWGLILIFGGLCGVAYNSEMLFIIVTTDNFTCLKNGEIACIGGNVNFKLTAFIVSHVDPPKKRLEKLSQTASKVIVSCSFSIFIS
jgi:hypothetical protein